MELSKIFEHSMLIYDDKCSSCYKFALLVHKLSNGWIRIEGHYYSSNIHLINKVLFPANYDPKKMFWLVNKKGAWGARSALIPLIVEVIRGRLKSHIEIKRNSTIDNTLSCRLDSNSVCSSYFNTFKRILGVLRNTGKFPFN
jgi:hypothetical protein